jgi:hypothetical protein
MAAEIKVRIMKHQGFQEGPRTARAKTPLYNTQAPCKQTILMIFQG